MKANYKLCLLFLLLIASSCDKILDRPPKDQITDKDMTFTQNEMRLYANQFYPNFPDFFSVFWGDLSSDNMISGNYNYNAQISGTITVPSTGGGWDWGNVRAVNYFLANYHVTKEPLNSVQTYIGEMYFWRAWFYFGLMKQFGALPWYNEPLTTNSEELYAPRLPRNVIADSILSDLDKAIDMLAPLGQAEAMRINKDVALAFKSRVALYEGTWEKYHAGTDFGIAGADYQKYFKQAVDAAEQVIQSGHYTIQPVGTDPRWSYWRLFNQRDLSANKEVIMWRKYDASLSLTNMGSRYLSQEGSNTGISRQLVDAYLCQDGKPISVSTQYQGDDSLSEVVSHRDPRLAQTIFVRGYPRHVNGGDTTGRFSEPDINLPGQTKNTSGYQLFKGLDPDVSQQGDGGGSTAAISFRYAEVLLNEAEAKAELGECTQAVLDKTINQLRDRVNMPHLSVNVGFTDPAWEFPSLSPLMNEIRRERRVELACEGFRFDDLMRWAAADVIKKPLLGAKYSQFEGKSFDPPLENIPVSNDGYIFPYKNTPAANGWQFDVRKNYLKPLPSNELTINTKLDQNPGYQP